MSSHPEEPGVYWARVYPEGEVWIPVHLSRVGLGWVCFMFGETEPRSPEHFAEWSRAHPPAQVPEELMLERKEIVALLDRLRAHAERSWLLELFRSTGPVMKSASHQGLFRLCAELVERL